MNLPQPSLPTVVTFLIGVGVFLGVSYLFSSIGIDFSLDEEGYPNSVLGAYSIWIVLFLTIAGTTLIMNLIRERR